MSRLRMPTLGILTALATMSAASSAKAVASEPIQVLRRQAEMMVFVKDEANAMDALVAESVRIAGYLKLRKPTRLVVRVPSASFDEFMQKIASFGILGERKIMSAELATDRIRTKAELQSRETMLAQYLAALEQSTTREDLAEIQGATSSLIHEIETRKGSLRVIDHDARYATIDITFEKRDRTPLRVSTESSFPWLKTIDVKALLKDFEGDDQLSG